MPERTRWLSTTEFATVAAITPQAARKALRDGLRGRPWRDRQLSVRHVLGAGGRGGLGYEVESASLPRVRVSRTFDQAFFAAGYSEASLTKLASEFETALKGLWVSRAEQAGVTEVRRLAEFLLLELCEAKRLDLPVGALRLSRRGVE